MSWPLALSLTKAGGDQRGLGEGELDCSGDVRPGFHAPEAARLH